MSVKQTKQLNRRYNEWLKDHSTDCGLRDVNLLIHEVVWAIVKRKKMILSFSFLRNHRRHSSIRKKQPLIYSHTQRTYRALAQMIIIYASIVDGNGHCLPGNNEQKSSHSNRKNTHIMHGMATMASHFSFTSLMPNKQFMFVINLLLLLKSRMWMFVCMCASPLFPHDNPEWQPYINNVFIILCVPGFFFCYLIFLSPSCSLYFQVESVYKNGAIYFAEGIWGGGWLFQLWG
jgi:hypothetical protein